MNIFTRLNQLSSLTESERTLVAYILENPDNIIKMNAKDISKDSFVSTSTIYRLCQKLDLSGLAELKVQVSSQIEAYLKECSNLDYNYPFKENETLHQIITKMAELYNQTLVSTLNLIDLEELRMTVQLLHNAKHIHLFPSSGNVSIAEGFKQNMQEIGTLINVSTSFYDQHWAAHATDKNHVVIVISYAAKTPNLIQIIKVLKKKRAKIILISATHEDKISNYADYHLYFSSYENSDEKIASFSSHISLKYILDCVYACYFNRDYQSNLYHKTSNYID